jgi:OOP family OmpA-OmpF porin
MRIGSLLPALLLAPAMLQAQTALQRLNNDTMPNRVPNPGFEQVLKVPCAWTQEAAKFNGEVMVAWTSPTETTPDLFSTAADPKCWTNPAKRTDGKAAPHAGKNMAGIKLWGKGNTPTWWHEYLQVELPEPLTAGERYVVECWVRHAEFSNEASNNLGILLRAEKLATEDNLPLYITPQVNEEKVLTANRWKRVGGVIEAQGGERWLLIGNFYGDEATQHERLPEGERGAYYFIDDVNLRVAPADAALSPRPKPSVPPPPKVVVADHASTKEVPLPRVEPPAVGKSIRLDNIGFEFGKATLTPESKKELDELADMLLDYPRMHIVVEGHTDDVGSEADNRKLSEDRAQAVTDFLLGRKVEAERIRAVGHGEGQPLVANDSEAHRALNRRVEFKVVER